jgi:hypothetical protein
MCRAPKALWSAAARRRSQRAASAPRRQRRIILLAEPRLGLYSGAEAPQSTAALRAAHYRSAWSMKA